ncbi:hypothetical protein HYPSUDRAFT_638539 [Hypholoma sublateritium FD-334 SS-4]|uniref:Uncharacterized protein n=1 Tax=Hypholoma sublateritium (strain FD-334 SS-4) TaxID=945553 RepID=A0A0D2P251_HYPSF|nr:hypothetical protein HYPSUDRAFT_638539 [Hypholoma sublateritium FD-334 SS-4]
MIYRAQGTAYSSHAVPGAAGSKFLAYSEHSLALFFGCAHASIVGVHISGAYPEPSPARKRYFEEPADLLVGEKVVNLVTPPETSAVHLTQRRLGKAFAIVPWLYHDGNLIRPSRRAIEPRVTSSSDRACMISPPGRAPDREARLFHRPRRPPYQRRPSAVPPRPCRFLACELLCALSKIAICVRKHDAAPEMRTLRWSRYLDRA